MPLVYLIPRTITDPRKLTQAVLQITTLLDLYQAELARILHLQCSDMGLLSNGKPVLKRIQTPGNRPGCWFVSTMYFTK